MTDTNQQYRRLTKLLSGTRKTLQEACQRAGIDIEYIDDAVLDQYCCECSYCGIWASNHKTDEDNFAICRQCA